MKTKVPTLSEAARLVYKRTYNGTDSAQNFLIAMKHNIKAIGDLPVNKITTPVVNKMMDYLRDELKNSKAVINTKRGYLKIVLEHMVYDGHIKEEIKLPKRHRVKGHKVHYLTKDMEDDLLTWLLDYDERAFHIVQALIDLGCRVNELLNLERRFVDMPNNQINFNERKNDKAVAVPMTQRVILIMLHLVLDFVITQIVFFLHLLHLQVLKGSILPSFKEVLLKFLIFLRVSLNLFLTFLKPFSFSLLIFIQIIIV